MQCIRTVSGARLRLGPPGKQEVTFADGSALWLHRFVNGDGLVDPFQRIVTIGGFRVAMIDLRELAPDLAGVLPGATTRDASFAVFHGLRKRFASVAQVREQLTQGALQ